VLKTCVALIIFVQYYAIMALKAFLDARNLELASKISKGYSAEVFLVCNKHGENFALKVEKQKSRRIEMVQKEVQNLRIANSVGVGPKLLDFDLQARCILMEFVDGKPFSKWLFEDAASKRQLKRFLKELFLQAKKLDRTGLSHGQLGGKGANILVRNCLPVIIDFEKASSNRKSKNVSQLQGNFLYSPHSRIAKRIKEILQN